MGLLLTHCLPSITTIPTPRGPAKPQWEKERGYQNQDLLLSTDFCSIALSAGSATTYLACFWAFLAISTLPTWPRSPEGSFFHPHPSGFLPVAFLWTLSTGLPLIQRLDNSPVSHQMSDSLLLFSGFSPTTPSSTTLSWQCWGLGRWHRPASFLTRHEQASAIPTHHILAGSMLSRLLISGWERRDFHCCGW